MMNRQANIPDSETRQRHVRNVQFACQELQAFTVALDDLITQLESEIGHQPCRTRHSLASEGTTLWHKLSN
jgi:hypothetical protein